MNRTTIIGLAALLIIILIGAYLVWGRTAEAPTEPMNPEMGASGDVIDESGATPETADLEAELNATGADLDEEYQALEGDFEIYKN